MTLVKAKMTSISQAVRGFLLVTALLMSSCGGGGGGGGGGTASGCSADSTANFYEVTSTCTSPISSNLKTTVDISSSYGFADGGGGGGDGGGGGGGGGGDLWMRVSSLISEFFYAITGTGNAYAQSISACGAGVSQSDLNKLTATGWQYQPMVKSTTPSGTACVKNIFDANKYLAVYATGLTKNDQTCYLVLVNKTDGKSHCFSSSKSMNLADDFDFANYTTEQITSDGNTFSVVNSSNSKYLGLMLRSRNTGGTAGSYYLVRLTVDSDQSLVTKLLFEGDSFFPRNEITNGIPVFRTFAITNGGGAYINFYKNVAGNPLRQTELISTQIVTQGTVSIQRNMHVESKSDGSRSDQTGFTYYLDGTNLPVIVNNNLYANPQCWIQTSDSSESHLAVMKNISTGVHDLIKFDGTNAVQTKQSDTSICLAYNSKAIVKSDGKLFYYLLAKDTTQYSGLYFTRVQYIDLGTPNTAHAVVDMAPPLAVSCGRNVSADLAEASIYFDRAERLIVAARSEPTFQSDGTVSSGGLSAVKVYDASFSLVDDRIPYNGCKFVRKFEKSVANNFAYVVEGFESSQIASLVQTTKTLDSSFLQTFTNDKQGQNFKIGGSLRPM